MTMEEVSLHRISEISTQKRTLSGVGGPAGTAVHPSAAQTPNGHRTALTAVDDDIIPWYPPSMRSGLCGYYAIRAVGNPKYQSYAATSVPLPVVADTVPVCAPQHLVQARTFKLPIQSSDSESGEGTGQLNGTFPHLLDTSSPFGVDELGEAGPGRAGSLAA